MIEVESVDVSINKKTIVHEITMSVKPGEFVGIIGPNGSGKSTLLKSIYRVLKPSAGAIMIDGVNLMDMSYHDSALKTAVVTQHSQMSFDFSVLDAVIMGRAPHKKSMEMDNAEDVRIAEEAIERVGMSDFKDRSYQTLSGGEQQRVVLARALAQQTPYLILDEPTNHLDIKYQMQLMDVASELDATVIAALHDLNLAAAYCDRIYILKNGRVINSGVPNEVITEEMIEDVYGTKACVGIHPRTGLLNIVYYPKRNKLSPELGTVSNQ